MPNPSRSTWACPISSATSSLPKSYALTAVVAVILMGEPAHVFLKKTKIGLAVRAVAHNKDIAFLDGHQRAA